MFTIGVLFFIVSFYSNKKGAAGQGFEPQFSGSEPDILPLDDPAMYLIFLPLDLPALGGWIPQ